MERNYAPSRLVDPGLAHELLDVSTGQGCRTGLCFSLPVPVDLFHHPERGMPKQLHAVLRLDAGGR